MPEGVLFHIALRQELIGTQTGACHRILAVLVDQQLRSAEDVGVVDQRRPLLAAMLKSGLELDQSRSSPLSAYCSMVEITFRLAFLSDCTYAIQVRTPDGARRLVKGFAREAEAEAWLAEQMRIGPRDEVWVRQPMLSWRT
jgi:hypothetical protein